MVMNRKIKLVLVRANTVKQSADVGVLFLVKFFLHS